MIQFLFIIFYVRGAVRLGIFGALRLAGLDKLRARLTLTPQYSFLFFHFLFPGKRIFFWGAGKQTKQTGCSNSGIGPDLLRQGRAPKKRDPELAAQIRVSIHEPLQYRDAMF
jgi:hypothetical protein